MDEELRDALREIREDIKGLLPLEQMVSRHELLIYGNGHDGLLTTVDNLKSTHKAYNRLFTAIGGILSFFGGNLIWKAYLGK